jgi:hypothetical protein
MAKRLGRVAPATFRQVTGCSAGEERLVMRSPWSDYRRADGRLNGDKGRAVLAGIRAARAEANAPRPRRQWS